MLLWGDTRRYRSPTKWDEFRSHSKEVVVHAVMDNFHRRLVAGAAVTTERVSGILTINRDKKCEISPAVRSKDRSDRDYRMTAQIVSDIISKENRKKQVSFADEKVDTIQDVSMPHMFLCKNRHYITREEDLSESWGLSISQAALTIISTTQKLAISALMQLSQRYRTYRIF